MRALPLALLSFAACAAVQTPKGEHAVPFIEDDYPKALQEARQRAVPLFVDAWAPW